MSWTTAKTSFLGYKSAFERRVAWFIPARIHPNHLSAFRLAVILLLPVAEFYSMPAEILFWLVVVAGLSDGLDGITARVRHQVTPLGSILDPVADKLFVLACFLILWHRGKISGELISWMLIMESHLLVIPILSFSYRLLGNSPEHKPFMARPNFFGKIKMILLISGVSLMFLGQAYNWQMVMVTGQGVVYGGLVLGGMALLLYIMDWVHNKY